MSRTENYIQLYKKLEKTVKDSYKIRNKDSISYYLINKTKYRRFRNEISYCQEVRNLLQHSEKLENNFIVEPSESMIDFISKLIDEINGRKQCKDIATSLKNIFWATMEDSISKSMEIMKERNYTQIPILDDGKVIGVFDGDVIFNYIADHVLVAIDELRFEELKDYLMIGGREQIAFEFVRPDMYVDDLIKKFETNYDIGTRIGLVFVTPSGTDSEQITGLLTAWDILGSGGL